LWNLKINTAKVVAKRMTDKKVIHRITRGYYSLREEYEIYELANLIIQPSYISLNTALFYHSVAFQKSNSINSVSLTNYKKRIKDNVFVYYSLKKELFFNLEGVSIKENLSIATPERAILESFYFGQLPNLDNIERVNFTFLKELSDLFPKSVKKQIKTITEK
jgi:predicted transcriptional regulator of viral defense system